MSIYDTDYDFFREPTEFEEEVDGFKEALRKAVKKEITDEMEKLRATVKEQGEKLTHLDALELEALQKSNEYGRMMARAERDAEDKVRKEGIRKLLDVLAEPRYRIECAYVTQPKCGKCDEDRRLQYTTPRGRAAYEPCECAARPMAYEVEEQHVHEISKRFGELVVWYDSTARHYNRDNLDSISSGTVLRSSVGVSEEKLMDEPREYGFTNKEDAQRIADAMNEQKDAKEAVSWA